MSDDELLLTERDGPVVVLTLNRPERKNALSVALRDRISDMLDALADDESVSCVVFTGSGSVFCSGFDLKEFQQALEDPAFGDTLWASSDRYHRRVLTFPVPTVAAVNGPAIAGGMDLAVMCDLRVTATTARFSHPEYTFGDVVYGPLHDLVGGSVARDLCMTGRVVSADEALALNLANRVVAADAVVEEARALAHTIAVAPRHLLARTKAKALRSAGVSPDRTLDL